MFCKHLTFTCIDRRKDMGNIVKISKRSFQAVRKKVFDLSGKDDYEVSLAIGK